MNTSRVGLAAAASGGKIYAFGGYGVTPGYSARYLLTVEVYDPVGNTWSSSPGMKALRYGLAAVSTSNGLVYLIGGEYATGSASSKNEEYIPSNGTSSYIAELPSGQRSQLAAVSINNGGDKLYVVGGGSQWAPFNNLDTATLSSLPAITPTPTPLFYPPAVIVDLQACASCASGSILLSWSSPGGSGATGTAASYLVRYATSPIVDQADWDAATPVTVGIPAPLLAGTRQSMTVGGLVPSQTYYFAVRARNAVPQSGGLSNTPSAQAPTGTAAPWTVMVYAAADNNLDRYIHQDISSLELAAHNTCINLVLLWDGAANNDSAYYKLRFDPYMSTWAAYSQGVDKWSQGELNMGDPANLVAFVAWAKSSYPAANYALVIRDHGDGLGGMQEDDRSDDHLTIPELDQALANITSNGADPLDLGFMDACLMGMLEDAYQFRGQFSVYVASEDVTWSSMRSNSHHDYFYATGPTSTTAQIGQMIVNGYANWMETRLRGYNYTMSAVDMAALNAVVTATNNLAASLDANFGTYGNQIRASRQAAVYYYRASYIDLYDLADNIYANISDATIRSHAQAVKNAVSAYLLTERHSSSLDGSHGVSIYFPSDSSSFYNASRYDFVVGATWAGASPEPGKGAVLGASNWGTLVSHYVLIFPGGPDVSEPPDPVAPQVEKEVALPVVMK
ncbi:MAG: clostripain-related cysteine peptidase [Anaerolineae bacterium]